MARVLFIFPVMIALFGLINLFAWRRFVRDVSSNVWFRRVGTIVLAGLFALPLLLRFFGASLGKPDLAAGVLTLWGLLLNSVLVLLIIELARRIAPKTKPAPTTPEDPARRQFLARATAAGAVTIGAGMSGLGGYRALGRPEITEVPVKLPGLPKALDGFSIVQLSDLHIGPVIQQRMVDQLVEVARQAKGDLLAITGDLVDGKPDDLGRFVARLRNIETKFGTYFVSGNHDYYSGWDVWAPVLTGMNFRVLRNERVSIGEPGASFDLFGVDDWGTRFARNGYDLEAALKGRDTSRASVLLAHQPQNLDVVAAQGIGLQLSGHTHGGQLFPATTVAKLIWGDANEGLSRVKDLWQFTSRGCGFVGPPTRLGAPPEVVKIVLLAG